MFAAIGRGGHRLEDPRPWILDDPYALLLVGPVWEQMADLLRAVIPDRLGRGARAGIVLRSRYAEDRLLQNDFRQYVILGAGLDSFVWRNPDLANSVRVYEVDHPATQSWKQQRAKELGLPNHDSVVYVPIDFETTSLKDALDEAGIDWGESTLFSWMAVTMYLTVDAIEETLRTIASSAASSSEIVLSYGLPEALMDADDREFVELFAPLAASAGEPIQTFFSRHDIEAVLERCGFETVDHPDRRELIRRYFTGRSDGLKPYGECFVTGSIS
jgi:methyltransferase (TIGR00027 family)